MTKTIESVAVYLGKSGRVDEKYKKLAQDVGQFVAKQGWRLVYGGSKTGTMGLVADGALQAGGKVYGVITDFLHGIELQHEGLDTLVVAHSMHERKKLMLDAADAFIILPGGVGTLDEFFEILTWRQIAIHDKPIIIVNYEGFWDPLLALINHLSDTHYILPEHKTLFKVVSDISEIPDAIRSNQVDRNNHNMQWI
jgi:uncharacterized protein (TIGR00730 family)